jgi:hypothetical protein
MPMGLLRTRINPLNGHQQGARPPAGDQVLQFATEGFSLSEALPAQGAPEEGDRVLAPTGGAAVSLGGVERLGGIVGGLVERVARADQGDPAERLIGGTAPVGKERPST